MTPPRQAPTHSSTHSPTHPHPLELPFDDVLARRLTGMPGLVLLDVDGTLAPIVERFEEARVPDDTRAAVRALVGAPATHVALVSGRAAPDALRMVGVTGLWAVGNHGFETIAPDGIVTTDAGVTPFATAIRGAAVALTAVAASVPGAQLEDKQLTLSLHYRRARPEDVPALREAARSAAESHGLRFTEGKAVLELRPPAQVDKGTATIALARRLHALDPGATLFFAGDDVTDEDAFRALRAAAPHAVSVRVGAIPDAGSHAEFSVPTLEAIRVLLAWMAALRGGVAS